MRSFCLLLFVIKSYSHINIFRERLVFLLKSLWAKNAELIFAVSLADVAKLFRLTNS